jgi:hypothetical protein
MILRKPKYRSAISRFAKTEISFSDLPFQLNGQKIFNIMLHGLLYALFDPLSFPLMLYVSPIKKAVRLGLFIIAWNSTPAIFYSNIFLSPALRLDR